MSAAGKPKRRIAPQPVHDDEVPEATLLAPTVVLNAAPGTSDVGPPQPGRRMFVDVTQSYEVNYAKLLKSAGVSRKKAAQAAPVPETGSKMPAMPGFEQAGYKGHPVFQKSFERVERTAQAMFNPERADDDDESDDDRDDDKGKGEAGDAAADSDGGSGDEEEEPEEQLDGRKMDGYDLLDDFIDDSELLEMMQQRDTRKTKHTGFFVNHGSVERVGDKVEVKGIVVKLRDKETKKRKKRDAAEDADGGAAADDPSTAAAADGKPPKAKKAKNAQGEAADGDKKSKKGRASASAPAGATPSAPTPAKRMTVAQAALAAARAASAGDAAPMPPPAAAAPQASGAPSASHTQAGQSGALPSDSEDSPLPISRRSVGAASGSRPSTGHPPAEQLPSASAAGHAAPTAALDPGMSAHAAKINSIVVAVPDDVLAGLPNWDITDELRLALLSLRAIAARTPPEAGGKKRKMSDELQRGLEGLVRLFYVNAEAAPNANRAKGALWRIIFQILAPWAVESTIKTKMQQINSGIMGRLGLAKEKFIAELKATAAAEQSRDEKPQFIRVFGEFVEAYAAWLPCGNIHRAKDAQPVWDQVATVWAENSREPTTAEQMTVMFQQYLLEGKSKH